MRIMQMLGRVTRSRPRQGLASCLQPQYDAARGRCHMSSLPPRKQQSWEALMETQMQLVEADAAELLETRESWASLSPFLPPAVKTAKLRSPAAPPAPQSTAPATTAERAGPPLKSAAPPPMATVQKQSKTAGAAPLKAAKKQLAPLPTAEAEPQATALRSKTSESSVSSSSSPPPPPHHPPSKELRSAAPPHLAAQPLAKQSIASAPLTLESSFLDVATTAAAPAATTAPPALSRKKLSRAARATPADLSTTATPLSPRTPPPMVSMHPTISVSSAGQIRTGAEAESESAAEPSEVEAVEEASVSKGGGHHRGRWRRYRLRRMRHAPLPHRGTKKAFGGGAARRDTRGLREIRAKVNLLADGLLGGTPAAPLPPGLTEALRDAVREEVGAALRGGGGVGIGIFDRDHHNQQQQQGPLGDFEPDSRRIQAEPADEEEAVDQSTTLMELLEAEQRRLFASVEASTKHVDSDYKAEVVDLRSKYERQKESVRERFESTLKDYGQRVAKKRRKKRDASGELRLMRVVQALYVEQVQQLQRDFKDDLSRLSRTHSQSVTEVKQTADKSALIIHDVVARQGKRNLMYGITMGLLLLVLFISLAVNYLQWVFVRMNGRKFILSQVIAYLTQVRKTETPPSEARMQRQMRMLAGLW